MDNLPEYELFAIRYASASRGAPTISSAAIRTTARCRWTISSGWRRSRAHVRHRHRLYRGGRAASAGARILRDPIDSLKLVGVDARQVKDVILTHLHYDHVGNFHRFPAAQFHLQEPEMHYATGRYMRHPRLAHSFEVEDVVGMVRLNFAKRVMFHNGGAELAPGITLHPVGGHSMGLQFVRVHTRRGWVVLASDATHFYENMERAARSPPRSISARCWKPSTRCARSAPSRSTSFPATTRW